MYRWRHPYPADRPAAPTRRGTRVSPSRSKELDFFWRGKCSQKAQGDSREPASRAEPAQDMLPINSLSTFQKKMRDISSIESLPFHDIGLLPDQFFEWHDFHRRIEDHA